MKLYATVTERNKTVGVLLIGVGVLVLLSLRFWASPIARQIWKQEPPGFLEFIGIPLFFVVVGIGIGLFLWEPGRE